MTAVNGSYIGPWELEKKDDCVVWSLTNDDDGKSYTLSICPRNEFCECAENDDVFNSDNGVSNGESNEDLHGESHGIAKCTCVEKTITKPVPTAFYLTSIYETDWADCECEVNITINVDALNMYLSMVGKSHKIPLSDIKDGLFFKVWNGPDAVKITPMSVLNDPESAPDHWDRIRNADLDMPIVVVAETYYDDHGNKHEQFTHIVDGFHRTAKAFHQRKNFISAYVISIDDMLAFQSKHFPPEFVAIVSHSMQKKYELNRYRTGRVSSS